MCGLKEREIEDYVAQGAGRLVLPLRLKIHKEEGNYIGMSAGLSIWKSLSPVKVRFWSSEEMKEFRWVRGYVGRFLLF